MDSIVHVPIMTDDRPLTADGPVIQQIVLTLEQQNRTLANIQSEAKENTKTLQQMQIQNAQFSEKMISIAETQKSIGTNAERLAVVENNVANLTEALKGYKTALWASVTFGFSALIGILGLFVSIYKGK